MFDFGTKYKKSSDNLQYNLAQQKKSYTFRGKALVFLPENGEINYGTGDYILFDKNGSDSSVYKNIQNEIRKTISEGRNIK